MIQPEAFEALASSTNGIAKLRELILELAVHGLLVPQDPNDEPASILLEKINAEKQRLVNEGEIKKQKALPEIMEEDKPFNLPIGWEWVPIRQVTSDRGQKVPDQNFTYIDVGSINKELGVIANAKILRADQAPSRARKIAQTGDVLYSCVRPYLLNIAIIENDIEPKPIVSTAFAVLNGFGMVIPKFLWITLRSKYMIDRVQLRMRGLAYPAINDADFATLPFPLPPLAEQHRIVTKVDELMALCDQLEQRQTYSNTVYQRLLQTLLESLTQAADNEAFQKIWSQIAAHFDTLFATEASVDQLKQVILQLAVMGKLVPQDPNDEPASELLKRIQAEKAKLIAEGKIKKDKALSPISDEEKPFNLPITWEWVRLEDLMPEFQNGVSSRGDSGGESVVVLRLADIKDRRISLKDSRELLILSNMIDKYRLSMGDILIVRVNGSADLVGGFVLCEQNFDGIYCDHFIRMRISQKILNPSFLTLVGASQLVRDRIKNLFITTAGQKTVNQSHIGSLIIPLMSVAEQHRIIAKVDELMAICDQLKSRINKSQQTQKHLATAIVEKTAA
ncbi:restriction endonuclease subunit S [Methylobacter sp. BBA5.1]|uniref:restriction endonuclease subunit S n=1 Tax=Methylobacter sp. BBA5.1 TaxID=1495064 RepID=UPI00055A5352|nr:restriction endonuclease subunit S [Methylobacter sp. BBA5.1]